MSEEIKLGGGLGPDIISPIYMSKVENDKVSNEMVRLEIAPRLPKDKINGVQLTPEQYDEYLVLVGTQTKNYLDTVVNVIQWESFPDHVKTELITDGFNEFKRLSKVQMLSQYPELIEQGVQESIKKYQ